MRSAGHPDSARHASTGTIQLRKFQEVPLSKVATAQHIAGTLNDIALPHAIYKTATSARNKETALNAGSKPTYAMTKTSMLTAFLEQELHRPSLVALDTGVPPTGKTAPL